MSTILLDACSAGTVNSPAECLLCQAACLPGVYNFAIYVAIRVKYAHAIVVPSPPTQHHLLQSQYPHQRCFAVMQPGVGQALVSEDVCSQPLARCANIQ